MIAHYIKIRSLSYVLMHKAKLKDYVDKFPVLIFDMDGVIIDSVMTKVDCIRWALDCSSKRLLDCFTKDFLRDFGKTRAHHFQNFFDNYYNGAAQFEDFYKHYVGRYEKMLQQEYFAINACKYAKNTLFYVKSSGKLVFLLTGAKPDDARKILGNNSLVGIFSKLIGAPITKPCGIDHIMCSFNVNKDEILFIGDSAHDMSSAHCKEITFLYVEKYAVSSKKTILGKSNGKLACANSLDLESLVEIYH